MKWENFTPSPPEDSWTENAKSCGKKNGSLWFPEMPDASEERLLLKGYQMPSESGEGNTEASCVRIGIDVITSLT